MSRAQTGASQAQSQDSPAWQGSPQACLALYQRIRAYQHQADPRGLERQADPRGLGYAVVDLETTGL
mgnify:FL=1